MNTKTAQLTSINDESSTGSWDTLTVADADGTEIDTVSVESAEDEQPYLDALAAAGHGDAVLLPANI